MKFKIVYDKPGRIRFRCGAYAFEKEKQFSVEKIFVEKDFVISVKAHYENGGILVCYRGGKYSRKELIETVKNLDPRKLENSEPEGMELIDERFSEDLTRIITRRIFNKCFLPSPISRFITICKSVKYIWKAIDTLGGGHLTVDVLDGASITACVAQKNYKTAGTIMFMLSVSALLEDYTRAKTKAALTESLAVKTDRVWLVSDNTETLIPMSELETDDIIRVRTGSTIPVDGEIVSGEANINESAMTGEPLSVMKTSGDTVFAGTVLEEGSIDIKVRNVGSGTKIQKIIELIDNSENLKAGVQSRAETLADSIVPFSFLGFGLTLLFTRNVTKAVSILMVDYSCAIKLSTPIAVISAIREASEHDITVKGGKYLEEFALADSVAFDKTGTLTNAEPFLEKIITFNGCGEDEILKTAACIEEHFPHSVARAIVRAAERRGLDHAEEHADVQYIVAHGIATQLYGKRAVIGSRHFVCDDENVEISEECQRTIDEQSGACSVVYLAIGGALVGALCISDPPRENAKAAVDKLKGSGLENVVMITGDSEKAAKITAEKLGINEYRAGVLPEHKHEFVEKLKANGHRVIMVGDGINDAPALAAANVSVAMSDASDIAKETADITLRSSDLEKLAVLRTLSERLMERINSNYRFIVTFNSALLILGFAGIISPSLSAFLHNASTMGICAKSILPLADKDTGEEK